MNPALFINESQEFLRRQNDAGATIPWAPADWDSSTLFHWFHGGVPGRGLASTIQGTGVGNATTGWNDGSGNARHVAQTITGSPLVVKPNGLEGIEFDRTAKHLQTNTSYNAAAATAGCWWVVFKTDGSIAENLNYTLFGWGSGSGTKLAHQMLQTGGTDLGPRFFGQKTSGVQSAQGPQTTGTIAVGTNYTIAFEADQTGGTWRMWLNESIVSTSNTGVAGCWWQLISADSQLNRFCIGTGITNAGPNANYFDGNIYEIGAKIGTLGADETNFLAHLTAQRAAA